MLSNLRSSGGDEFSSRVPREGRFDFEEEEKITEFDNDVSVN